MTITTDFEVRDTGSLVLLKAITQAAEDWVAENIHPDATWFGPAVVIEHRMFDHIVDGIRGDGLTLGVGR